MQPVIPIFLPQSYCPYQCVFCNQRLAVGGVERLSGEDIKKQISSALKTIPNGLKPQIGFYGGSFTLLPPEMQCSYLKAAQAFLLKGLANSIRISTRPDVLDVNTVSFLKKYGVETVELGAQVLDDYLLSLIERGHSVSDIENAVSLLKDNDFRVGLQLMVGLPCENEELRNKAFDKVLDLKPDFLRIHPTVVLRGSPLEELYISGKFEPLGLESALEICSAMVIRAENAGIPVIRIGLQSSPSLQEQGAVVAGPWHPSFGQLVKGEIYLKFVFHGIERLKSKNSHIFIFSADKEKDSVKGLNNRNRKTFETFYPAIVFSFETLKDLGKYELIISSGDERVRLTLKDLIFDRLLPK